MMGEIQGVSTPLVVKTPVEKVREVRIPKIQYRIIRSFVESSLKTSYPWRVAQETPVSFIWRKEGKWILKVEKNIKPVKNVRKLPVRGIYVVESSPVPVAILSHPSRPSDEVYFVALSNGEMGVFYNGRVALAFTREAPVAFVPAIPIPFSRPIPVYEVMDVLQHYVAF
jgi:hypothetical protein